MSMQFSARQALVFVQAVFLLLAPPHCTQAARGAFCDPESWNELSPPGGLSVVASGQICFFRMSLEALEGYSSLLVHLLGSSPAEARDSAVYCSTASCLVQEQLFLEASNRMLELDQFPEGIYIHVNNTQERVPAKDIKLKWAAVQADDACPAGQETLVLTENKEAASSDGSPSDNYADCIFKAASDQHFGSVQQLGALGTANGFWVSNSTIINASAAGESNQGIMGFSYSWSAGSSRSADKMEGREDGSMIRLRGPGQMPPAFFTHGFTALASSQPGITTHNLPTGSYRLEFDVTEGTNLELSLVLMQSKLIANYQSKNGREARDLQLQADDLDIVVVAFSVPANIPEGSCSFTLFHTGPLQKQDEEVLKQIDGNFKEDESVARISLDLISGEITKDIPENGELNRQQPASSKSPHFGLSKLSTMGAMSTSQTRADTSFMSASSTSRKLATAPFSSIKHAHALAAAPRLASRGVHGLSTAEGDQQQQQQLAAHLLTEGPSWGSWLVGLLAVAVVSTTWLAWNGTTRASWGAKPTSLDRSLDGKSAPPGKAFSLDTHLMPLPLPRLHTADCYGARGCSCPGNSQHVSPLLMPNHPRSQSQPSPPLPPYLSAASRLKFNSLSLPGHAYSHDPSPLSSPSSAPATQHPTKSAAFKAFDAAFKPIDATFKPIDAAFKPIDAAFKPFDAAFNPFAESPQPRSISTPMLAFPPSPNSSQHHLHPFSNSCTGSPHHVCPASEHQHHAIHRAATRTRVPALPLPEEPCVTATITLRKPEGVRHVRFQHHADSMEESKGGKLAGDERSAADNSAE